MPAESASWAEASPRWYISATSDAQRPRRLMSALPASPVSSLQSVIRKALAPTSRSSRPARRVMR
eukprot:1220311-Prymnesium_polylepis.1